MQSTPRGKTPGLPAMPSFGAQSVPTRHPTGSKHRCRPTNGTTPVAARASTGRRAALLAAPYSRCLDQGAQHLRTPRTSRFEVSTEKHRLRLDAVAAVLAVRRWPTGGWKKKSCRHGGCWPLFPGQPRLAGAAPRLPRKPRLAGVERFPACVLPSGSLPTPNRSSSQNLFTCISSWAPLQTANVESGEGSAGTSKGWGFKRIWQGSQRYFDNKHKMQMKVKEEVNAGHLLLAGKTDSKKHECNSHSSLKVCSLKKPTSDQKFIESVQEGNVWNVIPFLQNWTV